MIELKSFAKTKERFEGKRAGILSSVPEYPILRIARELRRLDDIYQEISAEILYDSSKESTIE